MAATVLVADDDAGIRRGISRLLDKAGHTVLSAADGYEAFELVRERSPDLVVSDVIMPRMDGLELTKKIKTDENHWRTRVLLLSSLSDMPDRVRAVDAGADGFLAKPFSVPELLAGVSARLAEKRMLDQLEGPEAVLLTMARMIESRDDVTGGHCRRLSALSTALGRHLGLPEHEIRALEWAGVLHDVGKIAVPDSILLNPGSLSDEQRGIMELHTVRGEETLRPLRQFRDTLPIVRSHHERQDGSGYPDGLVGDQVPITARVLQVADIYDALRTPRPYKPAWSAEECVNQLREETERGWWDRTVVEAFLEIIPDLDSKLYQ